MWLGGRARRRQSGKGARLGGRARLDERRSGRGAVAGARRGREVRAWAGGRASRRAGETKRTKKAGIVGKYVCCEEDSGWYLGMQGLQKRKRLMVILRSANLLHRTPTY